jgi:hypothetical protein
MRTVQCLDLLGTLLDMTVITAPKGTPLHRSAASVYGMARAYESDGRTFLAGGDVVNALASAWYGCGWLHFGLTYGLCGTRLPPGCPFISPCEPLEPSQKEKLQEKAHRYDRLLGMARKSVKIACEPETDPYRFSEKVLLIGEVYAGQGALLLGKNRYEDALACFSYGHGWIDAGVCSGLFRITGNPELFTV